MTRARTPRDDAFAGVREKLAALEAEIHSLVEQGHLSYADEETQLPDEIRHKLLVLGCSLHDYVFWVRRRSQPDDLGSQMFWAEEIESMSGVWGVTAREALDRYFQDDVLDRRRYTDPRGVDYDEG